MYNIILLLIIFMYKAHMNGLVMVIKVQCIMENDENVIQLILNFTQINKTKHYHL